MLNGTYIFSPRNIFESKMRLWIQYYINLIDEVKILKEHDNDKHSDVKPSHQKRHMISKPCSFKHSLNRIISWSPIIDFTRVNKKMYILHFYSAYKYFSIKRYINVTVITF